MDIKRLLVKRCTTAKRARDPKTGKAMIYGSSDLTRMAKAAYDRGEDYFYCKPADPDRPYGALVECGPEYEYVLLRPLTEEEYNSL